MSATNSQMVQEIKQTCICGCGESAHKCDKIFFLGLGERGTGIRCTTLETFLEI